MSLFAKAAEAKKVTAAAPKVKKKSTIWMVGTGESEAKVDKAVTELKDLNGKKKAIEAKMKVFNTVVKNHARSEFFSGFADSGIYPETPMKVQNADGETCTFVVQDRSTQYDAKPEQLEALVGLLGEGGADDMVGSETTFAFQRGAMMNEEILPVLEKHLEAAIAELTEAGKIEGFEDVLDVNTRTAFKPGTLQRLAMICGKDSVKMRQVMDAMGSCAPNYILA